MANEIRSLGRKAASVRVDVADRDQVYAAIDQVKQELDVDASNPVSIHARKVVNYLRK